MHDRVGELGQLAILGAHPHTSENTSQSLHSSGIEQSLAFSGFAEFTPITVTAGTVLGNADLERNK